VLAVPSLLHPTPLAFSGDPALDLPLVPDLAPTEGDPEVLARHRLAVEQRDTALRVARETGHWPTHAGAQPTLFHVRSIHGTALTYLLGEIRRRELTTDQAMELAFRLAVIRVENLGTLAIRRDQRDADGLGLVTRDTMDLIYGIGRDAGDAQLGRAVVAEIGTLVMQRAMEGVPPKS
jgi:hypothetical protein